MEYPDEDLPVTQLSLSQFVNRGKQMLSDLSVQDRVDPFVRFMLAGRDFEDGEETRVYVNVRQGIDPLQPGEYSLTRDYDSLIGITRTLPFACTLQFYPFPPMDEALTAKDNSHMKYKIPQGQNRTVSVPLEEIPNIALAKFGLRSQTRVFFPKLWLPGARDWKIGQEKYEKFYDDCLLPTIRAKCEVLSAHWPISYSHGMSLMRNQAGGFHHKTQDISNWSIQDVERELLARMDEHSDFSGAFFEHEIRGVKDATSHEMDDPDARADRFDAACISLDMARVDASEWVVDVAVEVSTVGHNLAWLTLAHSPTKLPLTTACYRIADEVGWRKAFNNYFPEAPGTRETNTQNFGSVTYLKEWTVLARKVDKPSLTIIRKELRSKFDDLVWIPYASDRIWSTTAQKGKVWRYLPPGLPSPAPNLYINPKFGRAKLTLRDRAEVEEQGGSEDDSE
ncbi:hypothetical protein B0H21DRAFT_700840 [Amylocystis lapponica]|nr:hypothetical protein B0H21DRAFT_700840 [Amylocystis lapponica]